MRKTFTALAVASLSFLGAVGSAQAQVNLKNYVQCRSTELVQFQGTLVDAAIATPELSTLTNLVVAANLVGALSGPGPFTVFAPTNAAFAKVPAPLLSLIGSDTGLLTSVLTYHVTKGHADPRKPITPVQFKTLQGQTLYAGYDADGASVNQSVAACKGVQTSNGTVWLIDSVLLPQFK
ncbi:fasciclin domain-containing protein [Aquabacterium lacunae]|uniref:Fasciclin domain-containing protein n=1 Tax=Aquabacterium lacunae TaxID=2528630 RepID=A0A4Q9H1I3_9BURK|nr:fasciclin domain-containing protein [Aquabacterium lacunae]TBO34019.1 fasciclin domain-containing protein [Aquabacterium lacunae]